MAWIYYLSWRTDFITVSQCAEHSAFLYYPNTKLNVVVKLQNVSPLSWNINPQIQPWQQSVNIPQTISSMVISSRPTPWSILKWVITKDALTTLSTPPTKTAKTNSGITRAYQPQNSLHSSRLIQKLNPFNHIVIDFTMSTYCSHGQTSTCD